MIWLNTARSVFIKCTSHAAVWLMCSALMTVAAHASQENVIIPDPAAQKIIDDIFHHDHLMLPHRFAEWENASQSYEGEDLLFSMFRQANLYASLELQAQTQKMAQLLLDEAVKQDNLHYQRLARSTVTFADFITGRFNEGLVALERLYDDAQSAGDHAAMIHAATNIAYLGPIVGQSRRAFQNVKLGRARLDAVPDARMRIWLEVELDMAEAYIHAMLGDFDQTLDSYQAALRLADQTGRPVDGESVLYNIAQLYIRAGRPEGAVHIFGRLLDSVDGRARQHGVFYILYGLAQAYHQIEDFPMSLKYVQQSLALSPPSEDIAAELAMIQALNLTALDRIDEVPAQQAILVDYVARHPDARKSELASYVPFLESVQAEYVGDNEKAFQSHKNHVRRRLEALRRNFADDTRSLHLRIAAQSENERAERLRVEKHTLESIQTLRLRYVILGLGVLLTIGILGMLAYQRRMIVALEDSRRKADQASSAKSSFLANISHELRTPLNAILGFSEMIKNEILGPVGHKEYLRHMTDVHVAGRYLLNLIDDILNISRAESGRLVLEEEACDPHDLIREAVDEVDSYDTSDKPPLTMNIAPDLPQIYVDGRLMRQAMSAVLANAVSFTPSDGHIRVSCGLNPDGSLTFSISDTGVGMTAPELREAQMPFGQIPDERHPPGARSGLGLNLARSYVERHGGHFELTSEKDVGSLVRITLPRNRVITA